MTAKEKANVLVEKFYQKAPEVMGTGRAQDFGVDIALIVVEEIFDSLSPLSPEQSKYWHEVVNELSKKA